MPKFFHCFYDNQSRKFGAVEIHCEKATTIMLPELVILAKTVAVKVLDEQITDVKKLLEKNPQLCVKIAFAEKASNDKVSISKIWI